MKHIACTPSWSHAIIAPTDQKSREGHNAHCYSRVWGSFINKQVIRRLLPLPPGQQQGEWGTRTALKTPPQAELQEGKNKSLPTPQPSGLPGGHVCPGPASRDTSSGSLFVIPGPLAWDSQDVHAREACLAGSGCVPPVPSTGSGSPHPADGRKGAPAAAAGLVLTLHSCFRWQRAPASVTGTPLSGELGR